jgi:hypothetical protein
MSQSAYHSPPPPPNIKHSSSPSEYGGIQFNLISFRNIRAPLATTKLVSYQVLGVE